MPAQGRGRTRFTETASGGTLLALAAFALLALLFCYPLGVGGWDQVVQPAEDPQLNSWILSWDAHALLAEPHQLFQGNTFYPYPYALAYSEHLLGSAIIALPLQLLFNDPLTTYGIAHLLTFVLSGLGAYLLGRRLSGSAWAGFIAGIIFAFCPYKLSQMHHLQNLSAQWMPFVFLTLDRFVERGRARDLALWGIFTWLQAMSCLYYALFLAVGIVVFALPRLILRWGQQVDMLWQRLWPLLLAGVLTAGCLLPFFLPYARVADLMGAGRSLAYVTQLSPDVINYLAAPANSRLYGALTASLRKEPEGSLWPGILALGLGGVGLAGLFRAARSPQAASRRGTILSWLCLTLGAGLLSLGPTIHVAGQALTRGPYILLYRYFPGFSGVRVPGRFAVLVMLGLAALASLGTARLLAGRPAAWRRGLALALIALLSLEYAPFPLPTQQVRAEEPAVYEWLASQPGEFAVVELPLDRYPAFEHDIRYVTASTRHWKRLVNGYSGYFPAGYLALADLLASFPDASSLEVLRQLGVRYVIIHRDQLSAEQRAAYTADFFRAFEGLAWVGTFGQAWAYEVLPCPAVDVAVQPGTPAGRPFLLKGWSHNVERSGDQTWAWTEGEEAALLLPFEGSAGQTLVLVARGAESSAACTFRLDGLPAGSLLIEARAFDVYRLSLPRPVAAGVHLLQLRCAASGGTSWPLELGETGVMAPVDLAAAVAGSEGGDYTDLYVAGKRYSVEAACPTCAGLVVLPAGDPERQQWRQLDFGQAGADGELSAALTDLPAGSIIAFAGRGGVTWTESTLAVLADYGTRGVAPPSGEAYAMLGVRGAPQASAMEIACQSGCRQGVGAAWPSWRLAVAAVELEP